MKSLVGQQRSRTIAGLVLLFTLTLAIVSLGQARAEGLSPKEYVPPPVIDEVVSTDCRTGASLVPDFPDAYSWMPTLKVGWFGNFGPYEYSEPNAEFVPQVRVRQVFKNGVRQDEYTVYPELGFGFAANGPRLGWFLQQSPGQLWVIGNEMEVDNRDQDNIMPELYAEAYHQVYHFIKSNDPSARVAVGPVSMVTPGRLQYLDIVWNTYRQRFGVDIPFDVWTFHIFNLPERTQSATPENADGKIALGTDPAIALLSSASNAALCPNPATPEIDPRPDVVCLSEHDSMALFRKQVIDMRTWLNEKTQGQGYKGLANSDIQLDLNEYGLLYPWSETLARETGCGGRVDEFGNCIDPARAAAFQESTVKYLRTATSPSLGFAADGNRLVQRWQWYSIFTSFRSGQVSNLLSSNYASFEPGDPAALSVVGQSFVQMASVGQDINLIGDRGIGQSAYVADTNATTTVPIRITYHNGGTQSVIDPFTVTFYADAALTQVIGNVVIDPVESGVIRGCNFQGQTNTASFDWAGLGVGTYSFWAKIDSGDAIVESDEDDNVTLPGVITVFNAEIFGNKLYLPAARGG